MGVIKLNAMPNAIYQPNKLCMYDVWYGVCFYVLCVMPTCSAIPISGLTPLLYHNRAGGILKLFN